MSNYDVFISHSSANKLQSKILAKDLENEGFKVWFDSNEIEGSEDWIKEIETGIDNSAVIVLIWTEEASKSTWVEREIARADDRKKPIIPLIFDDTEIKTILLQRIQRIDLRKGYNQALPELIRLIAKLTNNMRSKLTENTSRAWQYVQKPFYSSSFLEENNYLLSRNSNEFARNGWTKHLVKGITSNYEQADCFVTFVAVPITYELSLDLEYISGFLNFDKTPYGIGKIDENHQEFWFSTVNLPAIHRTQTEYVRHDRPSGQRGVIAQKIFRLAENGAVEYALSNSSTVWYMTDHQIYAFNFIYILGTIWKFLHAATTFYSQVEYLNDFQILINLTKTQNNTLAAFPKNRPTGKYWESLLNLGFASEITEYKNAGIWTCRDNNVQIVFNINTQALLANAFQSNDIMVEISKKLQISFNFNPAERHYIPDTTEFPWRDYYQYEVY